MGARRRRLRGGRMQSKRDFSICRGSTHRRNDIVSPRHNSYPPWRRCIAPRQLHLKQSQENLRFPHNRDQRLWNCRPYVPFPDRRARPHLAMGLVEMASLALAASPYRHIPSLLRGHRRNSSTAVWASGKPRHPPGCNPHRATRENRLARNLRCRGSGHGSLLKHILRNRGRLFRRPFRNGQYTSGPL